MKALVTISLLVEMDDEDEAADLLNSMTETWQRQIAKTLKSHGKEVDDLEGLLVNYGASISFPQPILEDDPR
jgi:hypothetical protein